MYFDFRNRSFSSTRLDGADRPSTSVGSVDEGLAFGNKFCRKDQRAHREILAVPRDHRLGDFGNLNEEGVFRPVFLAQFRLLRWRPSGLRGPSGRFDLNLGHHACPERWCSPDEGPLSNSIKDALSHSRSATRR